MTYLFRIRFRIRATTRIAAKAEELVLHDSLGVKVYLKPLVAGQLVEDAEELVMLGNGYPTEEMARTEGERWVEALSVGMVAHLVAADFEERRGSGGGLYQFGLDAATAQIAGVKVYNDSRGLIVVPEDPVPAFASVGGKAFGGTNGELIAQIVRRAYTEGVRPDERTLLACEMFSASHFMPFQDSQFLMLMVAVEALIERGPRPADQLGAIDDLVTHVARLSLSADAANSLRQTLANLRTESINVAGKRLARSLGERRYMDRLPAGFFLECYEVRSALVHGNLDRPGIELVRGFIGPLQHFVRDLVLVRSGLNL